MEFDRLKELIQKSFRMAIIKRDLFKLTKAVLEEAQVKINDELLIKIINKIPPERFEVFEKERDNEEKYLEEMKSLAEEILRKYLEHVF